MVCGNSCGGGSGAPGRLGEPAAESPESAILAVEQVAHGASAGFVGFLRSLALVGVHGAFRCGGGSFFGAASGTPVGEAGFIRLQFEFFGADSADSERESHSNNILQGTSGSMQQSVRLRQRRAIGNLSGWLFWPVWAAAQSNGRSHRPQTVRFDRREFGSAWLSAWV